MSPHHPHTIEQGLSAFRVGQKSGVPPKARQASCGMGGLLPLVLCSPVYLNSLETILILPPLLTPSWEWLPHPGYVGVPLEACAAAACLRKGGVRLLAASPHV